MRRILLASACALTAALVLPSPATASVAACTWTPTELSLPAGSGTSEAFTTNQQGGYSGAARLPDGQTHVVSWRNGRLVDHGHRPNGAFVTDVADENRSGTVVGTATYFGQPPAPWPKSTIAFRTTAGRLQQLPQPANPDRVWAFAINDRGDITGANFVTTGPNHGFYVLRWPADRPGEVVQLPIPKDHYPYDADEDGSILLSSPSGFKIWRNGTMFPLATVPGANGVAAYRITAGRVVGRAEFQQSPSTVRSVGVVWGTDGVPHLLPSSDRASEINRSGLIAGLTDTAAGGGTGVWRLTQFDHAFPPSDSVLLHAVTDDGALVGSRFSRPAGQHFPMVWRCV